MDLAVRRPARGLTLRRRGPHGLTPRARRRLVVVLAAAVTVLAVLVAGLAVAIVRDRGQADRRTAILAAARQEAVNFTTLDYRQFDRDTARVLDGATGTFRQQFQDRIAELRTLVTDNQAVTSGQVLEAGLVSADAQTARVLVAVDSKVTNKAAPQGQLRNYRLRVELREVNGRWLASDVQFVG